MNWFRSLFLTCLLTVGAFATPASATALLFFEEGAADGSFDYFSPQNLTAPPPGGWGGIIGAVDLSTEDTYDYFRFSWGGGQFGIRLDCADCVEANTGVHAWLYPDDPNPEILLSIADWGFQDEEIVFVDLLAGNYVLEIEAFELNEELPVDPPYSATIFTLDQSGAPTPALIGPPRTTAVPEPATLALLGVGLLALGWVFRRKRS